MQIDWFTLVAQIVNFLLLVWLLKRFLYGPITRAMEDREQRIAERMREAQEREREAEEEGLRHRQALRELEARRDELIDQASQEAEGERERLTDDARRDVQAVEERWQEALRHEQDAFLSELRRRLGEQLCRVSRQALRDLATADLETQIIAVFMARIGDLDERRRDELREGLRDTDHPPRVVTAFDTSAERRAELMAAVRELLGTDGAVEFRRSDELLCGVELRVGGRKLGWSIDSYLDELAESVERTLMQAGEREEAEAADAGRPAADAGRRDGPDHE